MNSRTIWLFVGGALLGGGALAGEAVEPSDALLESMRADAIRGHIAFLADDLLEGRGTGSRGYAIAARYVATQLEGIGLEPAGASGTFEQPVPLRRVELISEECSLTVIQGGSETELKISADYIMGGRPEATSTEVEAEVVFVGFGVTADGYDDYTDIDVRGKIVAMFRGAPAEFPSAKRAHYSSRILKARNAGGRGAVGTLGLTTSADVARFPWAAVARLARRPGYRWLDGDTPNDATPEIKLAVALNVERSAALFDGAEQDWDTALAASRASQPQAFPLPLRLRARTRSKHESVVSPNVAGLLRGSDPKLRDEYVVYTAHLDHEGRGEPKDGDDIYNGAVDNAAGVGKMIEIARAFAALPEPPRRSIVFVAVASEESGLLGSDYFAQNPTVPAEGIVANVNLDGGVILFDPADIVVHGAPHSTLGEVARASAERLGLELSPDPVPAQSFFIRSDQYSFVKQGVPAVFVFPGSQSADPAVDGAAVLRAYLANHYHKPSDDMNQQISFNAAAVGARLNFLIGYSVAQADERPSWLPGDFFGDAFGK